jgi:hypothetical protein
MNKKNREKEELKDGCIWDFRVRNGTLKWVVNETVL